MEPALPWQQSNLAQSGIEQISSDVSDAATVVRRVESALALVVGGSAQSGERRLVRLTVSAAGYSYLLTSYASSVPDPFLEDVGDVPLPVSSIRLFGQTPTPTATNANVGELFVSAAAGSTQKIPYSVEGSLYHSVNPNVQDVTLRIFSGTNDVTGKTNTVIVGQQINLSCRLSLTNATPTSYQWTVPGYAISNYIADASSGIVYSNFPTANSNIVFYWLDGANDREVKCEASVGGQKAVGMTKFNVLRPIASLNAITTTNQPAVDVVPAVLYGKVSPSLYLTFGTTTNAIDATLTNSFGIRFYAQVTAPLGGAGTIAFMQVVTNTLRTYTTSAGTKWKYSSHGSNYVDGFLSVFTFGNADISASETKTAYTDDTPGNGLVCDEKARSVNDQFKTYVMYQPTNGIWVTLRSVNWYWNGSVTNSASPNCSWIRVSGSASGNPTSSEDIELPIWSGNIPDLVLGPPEPDL